MVGYNTPATQEITLPPGGSIIFDGVYVFCDSIPPGKPVMNDPFLNLNSAGLSWSAFQDADPSSGLAGYTIALTLNQNGLITQKTIDARKAESYTLNGLEDGTYSLTVTVKDNAGNESTSDPKTFLISAEAPAVSVKISSGVQENVYSQTREKPAVAVSPKALVEMTARDGNGIDQSMRLDLKDLAGNTINAVGPTILHCTANASLTLSETLVEGETYVLDAFAKDNTGKETTVTLHIQIKNGKAEVLAYEDPHAFPNPFDPQTGVKLRYYLSNTARTDVRIYNVSGKIVWRKLCAPGEEGGKQDINSLQWDGRDNFGNLVAYGPYYYFILVDGKVLGKGEMCAFK